MAKRVAVPNNGSGSGDPIKRSLYQNARGNQNGPKVVKQSMARNTGVKTNSGGGFDFGKLLGDTFTNWGNGLAHIFGGNPQAKSGNPLSQVSAARSRQQHSGPFVAKPIAPDPGPFNYIDALMQAQKLLGGPGGQSLYGSVDYSPLIAQTRQTYGDASNRLLAMYQALHNSFQNDAKGVGSIFDQAKAVSQGASDQAKNAINQAYANARADQTAQFNALGIGDALANIVANGAGTTTEDQANALGRVATANQADQNQLNTNKSAALNYNTGIANSALQGGTDRAAQLQNQLAAAVAQLQQQQATANAQLAQANSGNVQDLADSIWNAALNGQKLTDAQVQNAAQNKLAQSRAAQQAQQGAITQAVNLVKAGAYDNIADAMAAVQALYG